MAQQLSTNTFGCAQYIVSADPTLGTHTTITDALNTAVAGQTVFVMPGIYVEMVSLTPGVNLCAFTCDAFNANVTIIGQLEFMGGANSAVSGILISSDSAPVISFDGTADGTLEFIDCNILVDSAHGMSFTNTGGASTITFSNCSFDVVPEVGFPSPFFSSSLSNDVNFNYCIFHDTNTSSTASEMTAGTLNLYYCESVIPFSINGEVTMNCNYSFINTAQVGITSINCINGSLANINESVLNGGSSS